MYWKYFKYILKHKWYVLKACRKERIIWRGVVHDMSKFYPSEFIPYARFFYGNYPSYKSGAISRHPHIFKGDVKREFDKAWLYHIHRNKHHWQHWLLQEDNGNVKNIKIPVKYLKEMVCDWRGAGEAITGTDNTKVWYLENKKCMSFKRIDRRWVEEKLGLRESERSQR